MPTKTGISTREEQREQQRLFEGVVARNKAWHETQLREIRRLADALVRETVRDYIRHYHLSQLPWCPWFLIPVWTRQSIRVGDRKGSTYGQIEWQSIFGVSIRIADRIGGSRYSLSISRGRWTHDPGIEIMRRVLEGTLDDLGVFEVKQRIEGL